MSLRWPIFTALLPLALALAGCGDYRGRLIEYADDVENARPVVGGDARQFKPNSTFDIQLEIRLPLAIKDVSGASMGENNTSFRFLGSTGQEQGGVMQTVAVRFSMRPSQSGAESYLKKEDGLAGWQETTLKTPDGDLRALQVAAESEGKNGQIDYLEGYIVEFSDSEYLAAVWRYPSELKTKPPFEKQILQAMQTLRRVAADPATEEPAPEEGS